MKRALLLLLWTPFTLSGQVNEDCEKSMDFTKIQVYDGIIATIEKGEETYLCPDTNNKLEDLKITLEQGSLKIRKISGVNYEKAPKIIIVYKDINQIYGYGKARIDTRSLMKTDSLKVVLRSGAKFYADLDLQYLEYEASEGGLFKAEGNAVEQIINVSVKATFSGFELKGEHGNVKSTTGAVAKINLETKVNAHATTGGQVRYRGNPSLDKKMSMGGKIIKDDE